MGTCIEKELSGIKRISYWCDARVELRAHISQYFEKIHRKPPSRIERKNIYNKININIVYSEYKAYTIHGTWNEGYKFFIEMLWKLWAGLVCMYAKTWSKWYYILNHRDLCLMSLVGLVHFLCYGSLGNDINKMLTLEWMENLLDIL